jgi:hypothetical protein
MSQNLKLPICPKCNDTKHVRKLGTIKLTPGSARHECKNCKIQWGESGISDTDREPQRKLNEYEINEVLKDYGFVDFQIALCQQHGFVYGNIYLISYYDSEYRVERHTGLFDDYSIDKSFDPTPARLFGVYNSRRGPYLLFNTGKHEYHIYINDKFGWTIK